MDMTDEQEETLRRNISAFYKMIRAVDVVEGKEELKKAETLLLASRNYLMEMFQKYIISNKINSRELHNIIRQEVNAVEGDYK